MSGISIGRPLFLPVCATCVTTRRPMSSPATATRAPRPWLYIRTIGDWHPRQSLSSKSVSSKIMLLGPKIMLLGKKVAIVGRRRPERRKSLLGYA